MKTIKTLVRSISIGAVIAMATASPAHAGLGGVLSAVADVAKDVSAVAGGIEAVSGLVGGGTSSSSGGADGGAILGVADFKQKIDSDKIDNKGEMSINTISLSKATIGKATILQTFEVREVEVQKEATLVANRAVLDRALIGALNLKQGISGEKWQLLSGSETAVNVVDFTGLKAGVIAVDQSAHIAQFINAGKAELNVISTKGTK